MKSPGICLISDKYFINLAIFPFFHIHYFSINSNIDLTISYFLTCSLSNKEQLPTTPSTPTFWL